MRERRGRLKIFWVSGKQKRLLAVGSRRGQAAVEFITLVGILGILFVIIYLVSYSQQNDATTQASLSSGWDLCQRIASEADTAVGVGDGYEHGFVLPADVNGQEYSVTIIAAEQSVFVYWGGYSCRAALVTSQVSGSPHVGSNKVKNDNGYIEFS